jgi:hypothetical protein
VKDVTVSGVPRIFRGGGGFKQINFWPEGRENRGMGAVPP